ncbi:hypothetical protein SNE40_013772 [Patella caerulea]
MNRKRLYVLCGFVIAAFVYVHFMTQHSALTFFKAGIAGKLFNENSPETLNRYQERDSRQSDNTNKIDDRKRKTNVLETPGKNSVTRERKAHYLDVIPNVDRLGNRMFTYASRRGIADEINFVPILSRTDPILKLFEINLNKSVPTLNLQNNAIKHEINTGYYTEELMSPFIDKTTNITIRGHLQSWKYFQGIETDIRKEFTLKADIKARIKDIFNKLNISRRIKVGVHVRRGDFVKLKNEGYNVPSPSYFYKAMDMFRKRLTSPVFVMCSDDKKWIIDNLKVNDSFIVHESIEVDFGVLMSCDHSIISSGTFGWWSAYLTKGTSIYFSGFPAPPLLQYFNFPDYYPPDWIGFK